MTALVVSRAVMVDRLEPAVDRQQRGDQRAASSVVVSRTNKVLEFCRRVGDRDTKSRNVWKNRSDSVRNALSIELADCLDVASRAASRAASIALIQSQAPG